jgi:hypothetical protein
MDSLSLSFIAFLLYSQKENSQVLAAFSFNARIAK